MRDQFGTHSVSVQGDVLRMSLVGELELLDMQRLLSHVDGVIAKHGRYGAIIDAQRLRAVSPDARRWIGKWRGSGHCFGNAVFGAGGAMSALLSLLARAIALFSAHGFQAAFFRSESEAIVWLEKQRPARHHPHIG